MSIKKVKPLVSVIMPAFNAEAYIGKAIESIINQTYKKWELVIVNDASTDNTKSIIKTYQRAYPKKIKAIHLKKNINMGGDGAGNKAFQATNPKSEFIIRMDADDIAHPQRIEKQVKYLLKYPKCDVVGSSAEIINKDGVTVGEKKVAITHEDIYNYFFVFHPMIHPTLAIRRSSLIQPNNLYLLNHVSNNDYLTFSTMICQGRRFANLNEHLLKYRIHGMNDSLAKVKSTFFRSLKTRWLMVHEHGYKPSLFAIIYLLAQVTLVGLLPEKWVLFLYLYGKGIYSKKKLIDDIINLVPAFKLPEAVSIQLSQIAAK